MIAITLTCDWSDDPDYSFRQCFQQVIFDGPVPDAVLDVAAGYGWTRNPTTGNDLCAYHTANP